MITLLEAQRMRIYGEWNASTHEAARRFANMRGFDPTAPALIVRTSKASGNPYLQRGWVARDSVANRSVALVVTANGRIAAMQTGILGVDYFMPDDIPGSQLPSDPAPEQEPPPGWTYTEQEEPLTTADSEPAPFGRLVKGYKAAPEATRAPTRDLRVVPHLRLNATQAEIVERWRNRTGRDMRDFAHAAITAYIARIADEEN